MRKVLPVCSVSGGKDSTVLYCLMVEYFGQDFIPIFADTGHEHPVTINYVKNLHVMAGGPKVQIVSANFGPQLHKKRRRLEIESVTKDTVAEVREAWRQSQRIKKSGFTFLDMCLWKGRAPSTKAQFCTEHLKLWPIKFFLLKYFSDFQWVMYTGIRAGESARRSRMVPFSWNDFFDCDSVLPLLYNSEQDQWEYLESKGVPPNPLYALGYGRVGCFPCIHANKTELSLLPDWAWDRLDQYEQHLQRSWFPAGILPGAPEVYIPKIAEVREWCRTSHGGRQYNMFRNAPEDAPSCMTGWIACE